MTERGDSRGFSPSVAAIFPLPLTAFERYMLLDDSPGYPMVFALSARLSGEIDRRIFESCFDEVLLRHPLLCALVDRSARRGPVWVLAEKLKPIIDWGPVGAAVASPNGEAIDLGTEAGLRAWVRQGNGAAEVTLQFHHACCDGGGSLRFLGHLLAEYAARTSPAGQKPSPWPANPASLLERGRFMADAAAIEGKAGRIKTAWSGLRDAARWLGRRPASLCPDVSSPANHAAPALFLETHRHVFEESETKMFLQAASRQRATVNDLLLRDFFLTVRQWNAEQSPGSADRWIRIAAPFKLKTAADADMPAANGVSYNFLTRRESECVDHPEFLRGMSRENDPATRFRRGRSFLRGFGLMERIPGAIPLFMGQHRCFATAVLSNLGDVGRFFGTLFPIESGKIVAGNLVLEDIYGAPPVRRNTHAAFGIGTYGGRLWITVRRAPSGLSADGVRRLLGMYADRLLGGNQMPR